MKKRDGSETDKLVICGELTLSSAGEDIAGWLIVKGNRLDRVRAYDKMRSGAFPPFAGWQVSADTDKWCARWRCYDIGEWVLSQQYDKAIPLCTKQLLRSFCAIYNSSVDVNCSYNSHWEIAFQSCI
ncbi:hypothetical protein Zmor_026082 [Zophobas morio]|uniref:Uncharacterized protein n=1 Tax=Zophobas morio TaxID=2755281 RepID=A0AA38HUM6_9CUCU|nr:hypothetical protein Zmor_026082 [Zophobas morio]